MSKSKKAKERRGLFGGAVCAFVNAQTTDEAYFPILTGIQKISRYSSSFVKKIKKVFPTIGNITPPPKDWKEEEEEIISFEDKLNSGLREKLGSHFWWRYIRPDQCFELNSDYFLLVNASTPSPLDSSLLPPENEQISKMIEAGTLKLFANDPKLSEIVHNKSVIEDISNLQKSWTRHNTILLHQRIRGQQDTVRGILDSLVFKRFFSREVTRERKVDGRTVKSVMSSWMEMLQWHRDFALDIYISSGESRHDPIREDARLSEYLGIYNEMPGSLIEFGQQDNLKELSLIREEDYFSINLPLKWVDRITSDLAYCLIGFLIPESNREYIGKCPYCHHFFIAERRNWVKCDSDDCDKAYERVKKRKQREEDLATYY